jgi:hypothetical protein
MKAVTVTKAELKKRVRASYGRALAHLGEGEGLEQRPGRALGGRVRRKLSG